MFLTDLFEARQATALQTLSGYLSKPNMYVSFVNIQKLGINPSSPHSSTPLAIYAYPLADAYRDMENKTIRFAGDRKYICVFEGQGNILDLQHYSHADYEADVEALSEQWHLLSRDNEEFAMTMLARWESEMFDYDPRPGMALWRLVGRIASRADRLYGRESMVISNSIFRKLGYDGVVDNGGSIIHVHEATQALFFAKSACRIVDFLVNDHLGGIPPAFPQRNDRKIRGDKRTDIDPE